MRSAALLVIIMTLAFPADARLLMNDVLIPEPGFPGTSQQTDGAPQPRTQIVYIYANGQRIAKQQDGKTFYFHNDHLGSATVVTDEDGKVVEEKRYDPFGMELAGGSKIGYNSKELDKDTKLNYYGARYYAADFGRFVTPDTVKGRLGNPQSLNLYAYTLNNPMKYVDPSGNQEKKIIPNMFYYATMLTPTFVLDLASNNYGRGIKALMHYLHGSGEAMNLDLSSKEWEFMIKQTEDKAWTPSTNPKYSYSQGWEYMTDISGGQNEYGYRTDDARSDSWNILGKTTLRRRKEVIFMGPVYYGAYHYMVAGESFDFVGGIQSVEYSRYVPKIIVDIAKLILPKTIFGNRDEGYFLITYDDWSAKESELELYQLMIWSGGDEKTINGIESFGKSFPIKSEYFKRIE
ncbi:MAG TPA: RHS repeat-associated core domain-containing protein [Candidatus Nanoarchaeia archaeon]|nr:RHS repeat-associated core domain-containing protein [Candidatus Nanoarchaeia archaeon]